MEIELIKTGDLKNFENNPRQISKEDFNNLKKSLTKFGFVEPLVIDENNIVIGGNQRLEAARNLNFNEIPCYRISNLNETEKKTLNLALNRITGEWEESKLIELLKQIQTNEIDLLNFTGFDNRELNLFLKLDLDNDFDELAEEKKLIEKYEVYVKEGEIYQLGKHKLTIGNAGNIDIWEKLLKNEKFDFLFTDPPYKLAYTNNRFKGYIKTSKGFGFRSQKKYLGVDRAGGVLNYDEWLSIAKDFQNPNGTNIMIFENWRNTKELWEAMEKYWKIKQMIIWHCKGRTQGFARKYLFFNKYDIALLAENPPKEINDDFEEAFEEYLEQNNEKFLNVYEIALFSQKGNSAFNRKKRTATAKITDHISWHTDTAAGSGQNLIFGTKPIPILIGYLKVLSNPNDIIMEPFGGSGSTLIACEILERQCRLIEIEPIYAQIIINRWERFTGKKAIKICENGTKQS